MFRDESGGSTGPLALFSGVRALVRLLSACGLVMLCASSVLFDPLCLASPHVIDLLLLSHKGVSPCGILCVPRFVWHLVFSFLPR